MKRKREDGAVGDGSRTSGVVTGAIKPSFSSGRQVQAALQTGSLPSLTSLHEHIFTPNSRLPLAINHPIVTVLQQYLELSPTCDEIFAAWQQGDRQKTEGLSVSAAQLLATIINVLTPLPFFRSSLTGLVNKVIATNEPYAELLCHLFQSEKRDEALAGVELAAAALHVDPPQIGAHTDDGRLGLRVWSMLADGGCTRRIGKMLAMRRRNKEGAPVYGDRDPLDRLDIRHALLHLILPLLSSSAFQVNARFIVPHIWSNLSSDPPITVYRILDSVWRAVSPTNTGVGVARKTALTLLNEKALEFLLPMLSRADTEPTTGKRVGEVVSAFLDGVTTQPGTGLCFQDEGWYPRQPTEKKAGAFDEEFHNPRADPEEKLRQGLHNRILSNVVRRVGSKVVDEQDKVGQWVIKVLQACPELVASYWSHSALALDPKLHARWFATMAYVGRIVSIRPPSINSFRQGITKGLMAAQEDAEPPFRRDPPDISVVIESIIPSPMRKDYLSKALLAGDSLVQHMTASTLVRCLQKLDAVIAIFRSIEQQVDTQPSGSSTQNPWTAARRRLESEARRRAPEIQAIIAFAQKSATMSPAEPETDAEKALATRSAMLTESALHLFRLYYKTMPSIAYEIKFDPGKLLVSSSSVKAERRQRKEARSSSVVDDTATVASVGTVGTAGMGGGFGHAKGDVQSFEALSQLHVLELLTEWRDWQWTNKAASSQYTYLYHILQLLLSTRQSMTFRMGTQLVGRLLNRTLLFEHDPYELHLWLNAMPRNPTILDPVLLTQQIHLLSFFDDCVKRCEKAPYKYLEDMTNLLPGYLSWSKREEMPSPLLMTVLEQLHAKIKGQHISTEAAAVILNYLRRLLPEFWSKQKDAQFVEAVIDKVARILAEAKELGQDRCGLDAVLQSMRNDFSLMRGSSKMVNGEVAQEAPPDLADEKIWQERSFHRQLIEGMTQPSPDAGDNFARSFIFSGSEGQVAMIGRLAAHLASVQSRTTSQRSFLLEIIARCLSQHPSSRLKQAIFDDAEMRDLFTNSQPDEISTILGRIVNSLSPDKPEDSLVAEFYPLHCIEAFDKKPKGEKLLEALSVARPWSRFFSSDQAGKAAERLLKKPKRLASLPRETVADCLGELLGQSKDVGLAFRHLPIILDLGIIKPLRTLLDLDQTRRRPRGERPTKLHLTKGDIGRLVEINSPEAFKLVADLVATQYTAAQAFLQYLRTVPAALERPDLVPAYQALLESITPEEWMPLKPQLISIALQGLESAAHVEDSLSLVLQLLASDASAVTTEIAHINNLSPSTASRLMRLLATGDTPAVQATLVTLINQLLADLSKHLESSLEPLPQVKEACATLASIVPTVPDIELSTSHVERLITTIVQDHLEQVAPIQLASKLLGVPNLKASFIRQSLQLVLDSTTFKTLSRTDTPPLHQPAVVGLIHALFFASPYVSCQPTYVEPLLPLYRGTLSMSDRQILSIFQLFEQHRRISASSVFISWSPSGIPREQRAYDALVSVDSQKVFATCAAFPLRRRLRGSLQDSEGKPDLFDPVFLLGLLGATLLEDLSGLEWVEIMRTNVLGLLVCSLSARDGELRTLALRLLGALFEKIEPATFQEQAQLQYLLRLLRHAIPPPASTGSSYPARLPPLITLFFAHALRSLANPANFFYPAVSRFFLQRPVFDAGDVPMLYGMLMSSSDIHKQERAWMLRLLRDGVRTEADWRILQRRDTFGLVQIMYQTLTDTPARRLILQVFEAWTQIPAAAASLVFKHFVIRWLTMLWTTDALPGSYLRNVREERTVYLVLLENMIIGVSPNSTDGRDAWVREAEELVQVAAADADTERLGVLSRIGVRCAAIKAPACATMRSLVKRVMRLEEVGDEVVERLFQVGMAMEEKEAAQAQDELNEVRYRVSKLDTELGRWVRRETTATYWAEEA